MSLRTKTLLFVLAALVVMIGFLYIASRVTLMQGLEDIEEQDAQTHAKRVLSALSQEISDLERNAVDWSSWDDTYSFIEDVNKDYIDSNLVDNTFVVLRLNMMLFVDSEGKLVYGKAFDLKNEAEASIPTEFIGDTLSSSLTIPRGVMSGIILTKAAPMILVGQPILKSSSEGPTRGTLYMGRYADDSLMARLAHLTLTKLAIYRLDNLPSNFPASLLPLRNDVELVRSPDGRYLDAYSRINDIYGKPAIAVSVSIPRYIYTSGQNAIIVFILVVLGIAVVLGWLFLWLVNKQILTRIGALVAGINNIASTGDTKTRISVTGSDELALVASAINGMLAALQDSEVELRRSYQNEKELRESLEEQIAHRAEYTRALVHELKTPVTPILAASELLLDEVKEPTVQNLAKNIYRSSSNLNRRIDELLDLARGEIGQLKLNIAPLDASNLLQEVIEEARSQTLLKGQSLTLKMEPNVQIIWADRERLHQVLQNLLNNAIKFTPDGGGITVRARQDEKDFTVEVEDTGRGISEDEQKRLFDPYHRRESDRDRLSGLGLGLAIAKNFIELHGGQIHVTSTQGEGTIFAFSIPIKSASASSLQATKDEI